MFANEKSKIRHKNRAKQLIDFAGLQDGKMMPTDIDGMIEFKDKAYIIFELKYDNAYLPLGQKIALERLTRDMAKAGKKSICFVCSHKQGDYNKAIDAGNSIVTKYFFKNKWHTMEAVKTLCECVNEFLKEFREV